MPFSRICALLLITSLSSCFYVSKAEYDKAWDRDGDGFPNDEDCAPDHAQIYPGAPDARGDGCDADCGFEADVDNDDWPDVTDCYGADPNIYPCAEDIDGDSIDSDCDGYDDARDTGDVCPTDPPGVTAPIIAAADCPVPVGGAI